ncbi:MAG: hypothetical protein ABSA71_03640 [Desulfomonilia bacterium]
MRIKIKTTTACMTRARWRGRVAWIKRPWVAGAKPEGLARGTY